MPIIKSAIKRDRQAQKRRSHNLVVRHAVRKDIRTLTDALATGDAKAVAEAFSAATSEIDRAVKKGTLHKNTAARKKSRLSALIKRTLGEKPKTTVKPTKSKTASKAPTKKAATKPTAKKIATKKTAK